MCLQDVKSSDLRFREAVSGLYRMKYFSVMQRSHLLVTGLYGLALANTDQEIFGCLPWSFSSQTFSDNLVAVLFLFVLFLNVALCV